MSAPLSKVQKRHLSQLARRAYNLGRAKARGMDPLNEILTLAEKDWRHNQVARVCGKDGIRLCGQEDYKAVEAHFLNIQGAPGQALNSHVASASEAQRTAMFILKRECAQNAFDLNYANAICHTQFKRNIYDATERQLWCIVYTIRNRAAARRRHKEAA